MQERSRATRTDFLDAAEQLFVERGVEATSVTDVVAVTGRSIGSLYHHFTNKDGLVTAVVDRLLDELERNVETAIDPETWADIGAAGLIETYVRTSLATSVGRPGYKRILVEVALVDPGVDARYRGLRARLDAGLVELLLARRDEIGHPDPATAARFAVDQLTGMLAARLEATTPTQLETAPDERFATEAVRSTLGYLRG